MSTKTVSELAALFGVTRQAMNKRVKSLDRKFVEKNIKNVTVVNLDGIHELEHLYGKVVTAEAEFVDRDDSISSTTDMALNSESFSAAYELISSLMNDKKEEIERLHQQLVSKDEQLSAKDLQIAEKDEQIKKQQELMAKALTDQQEFFDELKNQMKADSNRGLFSRIFGKK